MNIFFAAAIKDADKKLIELIDAIVNHLEDEGHSVYLYRYEPEKNTSPVSFQAINGAIVDADVYIGEMSRASQSLGFQLSYAISLLKPSLYLYKEDRAGTPDQLITHNPSRLLRIKTYNRDNYKTVLSKFLSSAAKQLPSHRTSFMSTKRIDDFIGSYAKINGISKGEAIRRILDATADNTTDQ